MTLGLVKNQKAVNGDSVGKFTVQLLAFEVSGAVETDHGARDSGDGLRELA
jgi:hypothetical protein